MASTINDDRLTAVNDERKVMLDETQELYDTMAEESDKYYQAQIDASKEWAETQKANQQAQTDFAIEKINQQKDQAQKDYTKEQSGAYVDWQRESNRYGSNAEEMAASGLTNTGYGESSQVRMYNTYQNRVAAARQSFEMAKQNYDNAIKDAQLQNNSILAEIAYSAYQQQLELSLQGFQYKNELLIEGANKKLEINKTYDNKYLSVLDQINTENKLQQQRELEETKLRQEKEIADAKAEGDSSDTSGDKSEEEKAGEQAFRDSISGSYLVSPTALKAAELKRAKDKQTEQAGAQAFLNGVAGSLLSHNSLLDKLNVVTGANNKATTTNPSQSGRTHSSGSSTMSGTPRVETYSQATSYLKQQGIISSGDGGVMTKNEWQRSKNSGSYSAAASYPTYEAYLTNYVAYKVSNSK